MVEDQPSSLCRAPQQRQSPPPHLRRSLGNRRHHLRNRRRCLLRQRHPTPLAHLRQPHPQHRPLSRVLRRRRSLWDVAHHSHRQPRSPHHQQETHCPTNRHLR